MGDFYTYLGMPRALGAVIIAHQAVPLSHVELGRGLAVMAFLATSERAA